MEFTEKDKNRGMCIYVYSHCWWFLTAASWKQDMNADHSTEEVLCFANEKQYLYEYLTEQLYNMTVWCRSSIQHVNTLPQLVINLKRYLEKTPTAKAKIAL